MTPIEPAAAALLALFEHYEGLLGVDGLPDTEQQLAAEHDLHSDPESKALRMWEGGDE